MKKLIYGLIILLAIAHQDFWNWNDNSLLFDFVPVGLAYHAVISLLAGIFWALVVFFAWPKKLDEDSRETAEAGGDAQ